MRICAYVNLYHASEILQCLVHLFDLPQCVFVEHMPSKLERAVENGLLCFYRQLLEYALVVSVVRCATYDI
jgi:hypothetical protein